MECRVIPRYWAISNQALETIYDFGSEEDQLNFLSFIYAASRTLLNGDQIVPFETDSKALKRAIDYQISEMINGFEVYQLRANARKNHLRSISDTESEQSEQKEINKTNKLNDASKTNQRPINDKDKQNKLPDEVISAMRSVGMGAAEFPKILELYQKYYQKDLIDAILESGEKAKISKIGYVEAIMRKKPEYEDPLSGCVPEYDENGRIICWVDK